MSLMSWFLSAFEPPPRHRPAAVKVETRRSDSYREAEERAEELLRSWLSVEQLAQYGIFGYFVAVGSDTGKRYRICRGRVFNIKELDADGREYCTWCLAPEGVTTGDVSSEDRAGELREPSLADREPKQRVHLAVGPATVRAPILDAVALETGHTNRPAIPTRADDRQPVGPPRGGIEADFRVAHFMARRPADVRTPRSRRPGPGHRGPCR
jgi:hypothetical protein